MVSWYLLEFDAKFVGSVFSADQGLEAVHLTNLQFLLGLLCTGNIRSWMT
jgi:hypothetical protein